ncbi:hypothetical protein J2T22_004259 [Pseudarthrobacter defluvii]|uniref:Uncharacterized protein n=1 Tax=Pseudarthrobacter defluvii TaxID=410837 RepID=A0ABT9UPK1_9MICC|nr:hypothetical protein [Pseudarthrobacter defluvii]MDQ0121046.1 hypothetical protein [Pseudarthrobacter defluvii]
MEMLAAVTDVLKTVALPLGIALVTARVSLKAGRQQIRAQAAESTERRQHELQKRVEDNEAAARAVRGETIESISDAIDRYLEDVHSDKKPNTVAVRRALFQLATRCSTEHLADSCRSYVEDSSQAPDRRHAVEAMLDVRRRLLGWHIGHLTLEDAEHLIKKGHREIVEHLEDIGMTQGSS